METDDEGDAAERTMEEQSARAADVPSSTAMQVEEQEDTTTYVSLLPYSIFLRLRIANYLRHERQTGSSLNANAHLTEACFHRRQSAHHQHDLPPLRRSVRRVRRELGLLASPRRRFASHPSLVARSQRCLASEHSLVVPSSSSSQNAQRVVNCIFVPTTLRIVSEPEQRADEIRSRLGLPRLSMEHTSTIRITTLLLAHRSLGIWHPRRVANRLPIRRSSSKIPICALQLRLSRRTIEHTYVSSPSEPSDSCSRASKGSTKDGPSTETAWSLVQSRRPP